MQVASDFGARGRVHYYVMGADTWREDADWPPPTARLVCYFLHSNGSANTLSGDGILSTEPPVDEPCDRFIYDPSRPLADTIELDCWAITSERPSRREVEQRPDVLCYTSAPLSAPIEIAGPITARLHASSSAAETDFTVALVDVYPDGYCEVIQDGILRTSYRASDSEPLPMDPGLIYALAIDLWSASYVVSRGHRLRVEISSSSFNRYDRNCNTGEPFGRAAKPIPATQTVYHTASLPSVLAISVRSECGEGQRPMRPP